MLLLACAVPEPNPADTACVALEWFEDLDGDGFGGEIPVRIACVGEEGEIPDGTDCDDDDPTVSPGADEVCNDFDDDCDGDRDEDAVDAQIGCVDEDGDKHGSATTTPTCDAVDPALPCDDCDDGDRKISPARWEVCDAEDVDEDCDGSADGADARGAGKWYADGDGDGYGDAADVIVGCESDDGRVENDDDCDDTDPRVHADAVESCDDLADQDCDGRVDELCNAVRFGSDTAAARFAHADEDDRMFADLVAATGDVTGDGRPDLAVTSPEGFLVDDPLAWVFDGTVEGDVDTSRAVAWFADTANFVAGVGDVDGDGFDDLAGGDGLSADAIAVHRSPLGGTLTSASAWSVLSGPGAGGFIADAGDLDGDGRGDLAVASWLLSSAVYAVSGLAAGSTDLTALPAFDRSEDYGAEALAVLDDDGDGLSEMFVLLGRAIYGVDLPLTGDVAREDARAIELEASPSARGPYLANAGDWDGDGDDDLVAGGVVLGPSDKPDGTFDPLVQLTCSYSAGWAESAAAGDFDGDARTDVVIAVVRDDELALGYGLLAPRSGAVDVEDADFLILATGHFGADLATSATSPGDTDGDGSDDILIASPLEPGWNGHEGAAWLFRGGDWVRP